MEHDGRQPGADEPDADWPGADAGPDPVRDVAPEVPLDPALAVPAEPEGRRYPSTIGGACYLVVLGVAAVGIGIAWAGDWRSGVRWVAGGLLTAGLLRLVLPRRDAGMLAVRHRLFDTALLAVLGGLLIFLSLTIPNQPPPP